MKIISSPQLLQEEIIKLKRKGNTIGFVPTMGYLHDGHLSLIRRARKDCDVVVVSIFVNPLQFGPREDLKKYPRNFKKDSALCKKYTDILFYPNVREMYPDDFLTEIEVNKLSNVLCGASRPGHFKGVATVVNKLFNIIFPDMAYFGQKDAQQAVIIKKMVKDLNIPADIKVMPTVREKDGLAMSSRNSYLSRQERGDAAVLYRSLILAKNMVKKGATDSNKIISKMRNLILNKKSAKIDYISIVNPETLDPLKKMNKQALVLLAVFVGKTRLIDNILIRR
ncbi:MAG: pantoate--beta-alanine ligase [Candidatus Omnitrophica bacterium]|nr:pantoate--beta-alanine ligase [Candidatus Omnitrophota bacterium]MDD5352679.1 pantoate--beta-alanine ligase [Candidatus Omnitrophota bacterium]MDD5550278.1 pantoate--beta-alanine ligase [Candidatus Omnitrophota bacterium]